MATAQKDKCSLKNSQEIRCYLTRATQNMATSWFLHLLSALHLLSLCRERYTRNHHCRWIFMEKECMNFNIRNVVLNCHLKLSKFCFALYSTAYMHTAPSKMFLFFSVWYILLAFEVINENITAETEYGLKVKPVLIYLSWILRYIFVFYSLVNLSFFQRALLVKAHFSSQLWIIAIWLDLNYGQCTKLSGRPHVLHIDSFFGISSIRQCTR